MSNLQLRIVSAAVLAIVVLGLTWLGGLPFTLLAAVIGAAVFYEWASMSPRGPRSRANLLAAFLLVVILAALIAGFPPQTIFAVAAVAIVVTAVFSAFSGDRAGSAAGLAYAAFPAIALAILRDSDTPGLKAILFLFAIVWATDIFAYFTGRALGGPKLAPKISPGKTWSGAVGGAICAVLAALAFAAFSHSGMSLPAFGAIALILSVVSQLGDLFESWLKRRAGVKDSGNLIPGHGGVMDRVDGLVAAAVALYLIGAAAGGFDRPAHGLFG